IALGVAAYLITGQTSWTALIPAIPGVFITLFGILALKPERRMHMMHGAVVFSLLGALAGLGKGIPSLMKGSNEAGIASVLMAVICIIHLVLSIRSFIAARRVRPA